MRARFDLPRGADPVSFDPERVNVHVTVGEGPPVVLRRGDLRDVDSWRYVDDDTKRSG